MDNELENLDLEEDKSKEIISRKDKKIDSLSEKLGLTEKEKEEISKKAETEAQARAEAEKERDFFKGFNQVASKYQGANDFQDKIWEKVKAGYDLEDATISIMAKEGRYSPPPVPQERGVTAGGSAATNIADMVDKKPSEMSKDELRSTIQDLDKRGELSKLLTG